jgi:hypothetical protein
MSARQPAAREDAELRRLRAENKRLSEATRELMEVIRATTIDCDNLHHNFRERHEAHESCPVLARVAAITAKVERKL